MTRISADNKRNEYVQTSLDEHTVHPDPFVQFSKWFEDVILAGIHEPNAMFLATIEQPETNEITLIPQLFHLQITRLSLLHRDVPADKLSLR